MLPGNRSVGQLKVDLDCSVLIVYIAAFFVATDEEHRAGDVLLPSVASQYRVAQLGKVAHVHGCGADLVFFLHFLLNLFCLLPHYLLFSFDKLEHLPAYLLPILVVTFQVRPDVGNHFSCLVLLDQANNGKDVEYFRNEVFEIEIFLLVHEGFHNVLNTTLSDHILLINERIEDTRE